MKKNTADFDHAKINKNLIRQLEDPAFAKAAEEYERQARAKRNGASSNEGKRRTYEDYLAARESSGRARSGTHQRGRRVPGKKPKKPVSWKKRLKRVLLVLLVLLLLVLGAIGYYFWKVTSHLDSVDTGDSDFAIDPGVEESLSDYRNIAILGSDARKGEGYDGSRTDAIIVMSINKKTGETRLISVMRDSYLMIEGPEGDLFLDKVTHAHAFGGGLDTICALNRNLDLNIKEFVVFNWQAVADTVDTLGGIEVNVKKKELKDLNHYGKETGRNVGKKFHKVKHAGVQTLDGVQATTYCRIRKNSGGDTGRAKRYKKVMAGVMKKMVTHPLAANELAEEVMPQIRTNMSKFQLSTLMLKMPGMEMKKGIAWPKQYYGGLVDGVWYAVPRTLKSNVKKLHKKAFGQKGYAPSETCCDISAKISETTYVY